MKRSIPLTGSTTSVTVISPEHRRFLASLQRAMERTLASGKIKILTDGAFVRRDKGSPGPVSQKTAAAIGEFRRELNSISAPVDLAPVPMVKAPEARRGPPPRPAFKRPSALSK